MDPIILILFSVVFIFLLKLSGKSRKAKLIDELPGPPGIPILGNALQFIGVERTDRMKEIMKRDRMFGPIYKNWIGSLPYVHIASAEMAEYVFAMKNTKKGQVYGFIEPWLGRGLLVSDGELWNHSRKIITPTFHFQILDQFLDTFCESGRILVEQFRKHADTNESFDIYPLVTLAALDSICETAMGTKIDAQKNAGSQYVRAICEVLPLIFHRYDRFWLHHDWFWQRSKAGKEAKEKIDILHAFTDNVIRERRETRMQASAQFNEEEDGVGVKKKKAFLDLLLDECDKQNTTFSDYQLRSEVNTFMFEGHDTTTATLCFTMFALGTYTSIQEKVYQEQLSVMGSSKDRAPSMRDLSDMKILDRVVKETLRVYPSVPFISRTLTEDTKIGDYLIPVGSIIFVSLASILKDPKHFPDPDKFDPDRYLPENAVGRNPFAHIPFSAGSRNCIGQRFAMIEAKTFLSYAVRNFKIEAITTVDELKTVVEIVQKPATPLKIKLTSRA